MRDLNKPIDGEAILEYDHGQYRIIRPGQFVVCAVTGKKIMLRDLKYWDVATQQPFCDAEAALKIMRPDRKA